MPDGARRKANSIHSASLAPGRFEWGKPLMGVEAASLVNKARARSARLTPQERREEILAAATRLISQSGFNAVSQAEVAKACGVGKSLVTHYFSSMNALLAAVLDTKDKVDFAMLSGATYPASEPAAVRAFITRHIENNLERWELIRLHRMLDVEALDPAHPAHDYFTERYRQTREIAADLLAFKREPEQAAQELLAFWHGLEMAWLRNRELQIMLIWNSFADRFFVADEQDANKPL